MQTPPLRAPLSVLMSAVLALPALAQTTPPAKAELDTVTVTGIRASVKKALDAKEASNSMVEVIASEDIGKLPDTTIAETLARLPGLSSGLDRGNASQVIARGMGPRFIGATLNGRELASSEPGRAVRFEQFPSESISGATIYKTQSAEIAEGGIATSIDLQTVKPLDFRGRQASVKLDGLYYALGSDLPGSKSKAPRLGGIYVDQFADRSLGLALAFSYQDQPSLQKNVRHWGFNENNSVDLNGDGKVDKTPWGFGTDVKRGTDKRTSLLGKLEFKPWSDALITADAYVAKAAIREPGLQHWTGDVGNWDGWQSARYSNVDIRDGYVVGASVSDVWLTTNDYVWVQDNEIRAAGLNGQFKIGDWKLESDLSSSRASRDSQWRDVRQFSLSGGTLSWSFTGDERQQFTIGQDSGNPTAFGQPTLHVDTDGHIADRLDALSLNLSRALNAGDFKKLKFGARLSDREKSYHQTTWSLQPQGNVPASAFETVIVPGMAPFIALKDFYGTVAAAFGSDAFNPAGRAPTPWDLLAGWQVSERSSALHAQADLDGQLFGLPYRGNLGLRVVHTSQTGAGMQSLNGAAPTAFETGTSYTEWLPSLNLIFGLDADQSQQLRVGLARAMTRAPLDEMRGSRNLAIDQNPVMPITGSAGNPLLKPMVSDQLDVAYQWYFAPSSLASAGLFYKRIGRYIGITTDSTTIDGRAANISRPVNGKGGHVQGIELIFQHSFGNGLGLHAHYAYSDSNIKENTPAVDPYPIEGLMKHNGGLTLWYTLKGFEARFSANHHSGFVRNPSWTSGQLILNEPETYLTLNLSQQLTTNLQLRFGVDNLTNQKAVFTSANNRYQQEVTEWGRRYNIGLSYKL